MVIDLTSGVWLASYLGMLAAAGWSDAMRRRIPNALVIAGALGAIALSTLPAHGIGLASSLAGLALGLAIPAPLYLMRAMGAGDVKLLGAAGAFVGFPDVLAVLLATFIAGGLLSIAWALRARDLPAVLGRVAATLRGFMAPAPCAKPGVPVTPLASTRIPFALCIGAGAVAQLAIDGRLGWTAGL